MRRKLTKTDIRLRKEIKKFEAGAEPSPWLLRQCMRPKRRALCERVLPGLYRSIHPKTLKELWQEAFDETIKDWYADIVKAQLDTASILYKYMMGENNAGQK